LSKGNKSGFNSLYLLVIYRTLNKQNGFVIYLVLLSKRRVFYVNLKVCTYYGQSLERNSMTGLATLSLINHNITNIEVIFRNRYLLLEL